MDKALRGLWEIGRAPHPPNFIVIYKQGGNHIQNLKLSQEEVPVFNYILILKRKNLINLNKQN